MSRDYHQNKEIVKVDKIKLSIYHKIMKYLDLQSYLNFGATNKTFYAYTHSIVGISSYNSNKKIKKKNKGLDLFKKKFIPEVKNINSSSKSIFSVFGNIMSTINDYTYGAITSQSNVSNEKTYSNEEIISMKEKLSFWEEILEEQLNQRTLQTTIKENRKVIDNIYFIKSELAKNINKTEEEKINKKLKEKSKADLNEKISLEKMIMNLNEEIEALNKEESSNNEKLHQIQAYIKDNANQIKVYEDEILTEEDKERIKKLQKFII